jgi:hypothetical protein
MIGCDVSQSENGGGDNRKEPSYFTVSFYDVNLDFNGSISVDKSSPDINITKLMTDLALNATHLYRAGSAEKVETNASYPITGDTNFYAIANITEITTQAGLAAITTSAATLDGNYTLLKDIALDQSGAGFEGAYGWKPMGDDSDPFKGIFNGNGHKITGLWIERPSMDYVGLFSYIEGAKIRNLGVEINSGKGGVQGDVNVGGIAGHVDNNSSITNSYSTGNVSGNGNVGGIAGRVSSSSSITNSYSTANVSSTGDSAGGIAGDVSYSSTITNSYSTGDVSATGGTAGGIAGDVRYSSSITDSYSTGDVSGAGNYVGGIAGDVYDYSTIKNNAAINQEINGSSDVNRIVGYIYGSTSENNFALEAMVTNLANFSNVGDPANHGTSKSIVELTSQSTYESAINGDGLGGLGWKFGSDASNPWKIDANKNGGLPYLYWEDR